MARPSVIILAVLAMLALMGGLAGGGTFGEPLDLRPLPVASA
jgi:hypothetical protein